MDRFCFEVRRNRTFPGQVVPFLHQPAEVVQALAAFGLIWRVRAGVYLLTARGYVAAWQAPEVIEMVDGEVVL